MSERAPNPQINASKIVAGGGIAGALFAVISTVIFLIGIPALRYFLPAAIVLGCVVALVIHFKRYETPGRPWILATPQNPVNEASDPPTETSSHCGLVPSVNFS